MIPLSKRSRCGGFTLVEVLVTLGVMMLLIMLVGPPLAKYIQRSKLQGVVNQTATLMRLARIQAIKRSSHGVVEIDSSNNPYGPHVRAFVDLDRNGAWGGASEPLLGRALLERGITFLPTDGFDDSGGDAVFQESGAAEDEGAFRFADAKGNEMEVDVQAPTTRIEIHKNNGLGSWVANGEGGKAWTWK